MLGKDSTAVLELTKLITSKQSERNFFQICAVLKCDDVIVAILKSDIIDAQSLREIVNYRSV